MFQSTPSAREGDGVARRPNARELFVSIHAFREGRRQPVHLSDFRACRFQSTPSAREGDVCADRRDGTGQGFNPRLPRGKATDCQRDDRARETVSIHAFREGRRLCADRRDGTGQGFNPRLPRGKATLLALIIVHTHQFQSTPSAREGDL